MSKEESAARRHQEEISIPGSASLEESVHSTSNDVLLAVAADPSLGEDLALTLLRRRDLQAQVLERLSKNSAVMKYRRVKMGLAANPRTPRHVALAILRHLFTFDLMQVALTPAVPADIKMAADEALINRLETTPSGERSSLAHRASGQVAGVLLLDLDRRVIEAALLNPRLTEAAIFKAITRADASAALVEAVCRHAKWSLRREIRGALLRSEHTPPERALEFARSLPVETVREILHGSQLPDEVKSCMERELEVRLNP